MERRNFIKLCGSSLLAVAASPALLAQTRLPLKRYARTRLVYPDGKPVRAAGLPRDETFVFFYPFQSTPCYLVRLGTLVQKQTLQTADGRTYQWNGGVGREGNIVAFSAICTHLMTHPTRDISFINYHADADQLSGEKNVITCCAHGSVFDPARGGKVLTGPATQPLTAIGLEHDPATDQLWAVGTHGGEVYNDFLRTFKRELRKAFGRGAYRKLAAQEAVVTPLDKYTRNRISC